MATKNKAGWAALPSAAPRFDFSGDALKKAWKDLHAGDREPFPDDKRAAALIKALGKSAPKGLDAGALADALQDAWRGFHEGRFEAGFDGGKALGAAGASVATKCLGVHAAYLVDDKAEALSCFQSLVTLADEAVTSLPGEANSHYRRAFGLGRHSQGISVVKALKDGMAGKVRESLDRALALEPEHAEARLALAMYHAEIVSKVGGMIAGLTYGAKGAEAEKQIAEAMRLFSKSPVTLLEKGNVALLLKGAKGEDEAAACFEKAAKTKSRDAMEWLDAREAASRIE